MVLGRWLTNTLVVVGVSRHVLCPGEWSQCCPLTILVTTELERTGGRRPGTQQSTVCPHWLPIVTNSFYQAFIPLTGQSVIYRGYTRVHSLINFYRGLRKTIWFQVVFSSFPSLEELEMIQRRTFHQILWSLKPGASRMSKSWVRRCEFDDTKQLELLVAPTLSAGAAGLSDDGLGLQHSSSRNNLSDHHLSLPEPCCLPTWWAAHSTWGQQWSRSEQVRQEMIS